MSKQPKQSGVTPKGAVEVDEEDLDKAAGGVSLNYSKFQLDYGKVGPEGIVSAGPGGGPHIAPAKKA